MTAHTVVVSGGTACTNPHTGSPHHGLLSHVTRDAMNMDDGPTVLIFDGDKRVEVSSEPPRACLEAIRKEIEKFCRQPATA